MKNRTAVHTIKGYFYQFDYSILQVLQSKNDEDIITIEGIEDIDVFTADDDKAIQCKYYEKTEYNHSVIKMAIIMMLRHFKENIEKELTYNIYGHYLSGQEKLPDKIDISFLKEKFLKYTRKNKVTGEIETCEEHIQLSLTDNDLEQFLERLYINVNAPNFEEQNKIIIEKIKNVFSCDSIDAEFFYNNALSLIRQLSVESDLKKRKISRRVFLEKINGKEELFNTWYLTLREKNDFLKLMKSKYFSAFNISPYSRFILIDCEDIVDEVQLKQLLIYVSDKLSKITCREPKPFCPYVYVHGVSEHKLKVVKQLLMDDNHIFIDGHNFKDADFNLSSILKSPNCHNQIKLKIINDIRNIDLILENLSNTRKIFQFYIDLPFYECSLHEHHRIPITSANDIKQII